MDNMTFSSEYKLCLFESKIAGQWWKILRNGKKVRMV